MSVTFPKGFIAGVAAAGLKSNKKLDIAVVQNIGDIDSAAAVFTSNRAKANPVLWSEQAIADGSAAAIVLNSGGANCYTGSEGFITAHKSAELVAETLAISASDVLVCSTGLIGVQLDKDKLFPGIAAALANLSEGNGERAAEAIMTTDSKPKLAKRESHQGWRIGAIAKGAGMLAPSLATMLVVITTDAKISSELLGKTLREATSQSFDRLDSDGCTSTNDTVALMASGASGIEPELEDFQQLLSELCIDLAKQLLADAEGASHEIAIAVSGAASVSDAESVGRAIARNSLVKTAIYGKDPNWGRILAAIGTSQAQFDPYNVDVSINGVRVSTEGREDRDRSEVDFSSRSVSIAVDLKVGDASATIWTNDLTVEYVKENSEYSS